MTALPPEPAVKVILTKGAACDPKRTFNVNPRNFLMLITFVFIAPVATADTQDTHGVTVADIRELKPGPNWNPSVDEVLVRVRGYLRGSKTMRIYATKDQALLDDPSGVSVSTRGDEELQKNCGDSFVDLVAKLKWMASMRAPYLIPTEVKKLALRENHPAEEQYCWKLD